MKCVPTNSSFKENYKMTITYIKAPIISNVFCDKLTITLKVDPKHHDFVKNGMYELINNGYAKKTYTPQYQLSVRLGIGDYNEHTALIQCSPHPYLLNHSFFRIEFNPDRIGIEGMCFLKTRLDELLPNGYKSLIQHGTCTRFDVSIDIVHMEIDKFVFRAPKMRRSKSFYNGKKTIRESYYIGGDNSKRQFCIYDKVAEIKNNNSGKLIKTPIPNHPVTRIEVRNKYRIPMTELINVDNQFLKLEIYFLNKIQKSNLEFDFFLDSVRLRGLISALYKIESPYERKKYIAQMESAKNKYWKPEKHWESWVDVVNEIYHPVNPKISHLLMHKCN